MIKGDIMGFPSVLPTSCMWSTKALTGPAMSGTFTPVRNSDVAVTIHRLPWLNFGGIKHPVFRLLQCVEIINRDI